MTELLFGLIMISWFVYVKLKLEKPSLKALFFKCSTTFLIILMACIFVTEKQNHLGFGLSVIIALTLGLLGDIFLDLKLIYKNDDSTFTYAGFVSFILGHLLYIYFLLSHYETNTTNLIIISVVSLLIVGLVLITEKPTKLNFGEFRLISAFYAFILSFVILLSLDLYLVENQVYLLIFGIGMILFLISDLILSHSYFGKHETKGMIIGNYIFYYAAQALIAYSVYKI